MSQWEYIFYRGNYKNLKLKNLKLEKDYRFEIWRPGIYRLTPPKLFFKNLLGWWLLHYFKIFKSYDYKLFVIYFKNGEVVHYSVILPKYFSTPFMRNGDLQIGPVGTDKKHRRKGLALFAIAKIIEFYKDKDINFWYISRKENEPSKRLIEKIGFVKYGEGVKVKKFGLNILGSFVIKNNFYKND